MKIVFFGDSITDAGRDYTQDFANSSYGFGYPYIINAYLTGKHPNEYEVRNRGVGGDRVVDLYARIKADVWNFEPDILSILIGVNDVWHDINRHNGVDLVRFEKVYRMIIEDTLKVVPNVKIVLMEPFVLKGGATEEHFDKFLEVKDYAKVVKKLADEYKLVFVPLQKVIEDAAEKYGSEYCLRDGVHPKVGGAYLISEQWIKTVLGEKL